MPADGCVHCSVIIEFRIALNIPCLAKTFLGTVGCFKSLHHDYFCLSKDTCVGNYIICMYANMYIGLIRMNSDLSFAKGVNCIVRLSDLPPSVTSSVKGWYYLPQMWGGKDDIMV